MFCEPSPAPAKYGASLLGFCEEGVRLPIVPCSEAAKSQVRQAMTHAGLIN
jgi:4-hydroxy-tetrahydrodipicolinate synthase